MSTLRPPHGHDRSLHGGGEWLFKKSGEVFGPVAANVIVQMLYKGEVTGETPVAGDDGAFRPLSDTPAFLVQVKKAEAQLRVEAEVTGARLLRRRKRIRRGSAVAVVAAGLLGAGGYGAYWLATAKPWQKRSALLEDFGGGVQLAVAARIGGRHSGAAGEAEIEVPVEPGPGGATRPARRSSPAARPNTGGAASGDLVAAQYDVTHIQAVVAREQRSLAPCLRAEAQRSPDFSGDIPLEFAIGNEGRVVQLWIDEARFKHGALHECLLRTLRTWSFKSFPGQRPTVSLSFRIGAR